MRIGFGTQCLTALVLGALFGAWANITWVTVLEPIGVAFLQLLQMIIIPLTFSLIVTSFSKLDNIVHIRKLGSRTLGWFALTALIAASVGLLAGLWINPGHGFDVSHATARLREVPPAQEIFLDMVPGNLIEQISRGKIIPVIIFAILFGVALTLVKEKAKGVADFFAGMSNVMFKITRWVIRLSPIGIFVLIAQVSAHYGLQGLLPFIKFILCVYAACAVQLIVYSILILITLRVNPWLFFRAAWPMMLVAFTTSSSLGTLPVTIETLVKRVGVPADVAAFVGPLGATMKMDGCGAIYPAITAIFTATLFHIPLDWQQYLIIIITATIATIGTAGVPGTASVMAMVVLSSVGLPYAGLAMVIGIDKVIDMVRTTVNVTGTGVCSTLVAATTEKSWGAQIREQLKQKYITEDKLNL